MEESDLPVTEIFVTKVNGNNSEAYRKWVKKIRDIESQFPGFQATHVQAPISGKNDNWITLLQFDSQKHLDRWMNSEERQKILQEATLLITSLQTHRVISPFAGWFAENTIKATPPPIWKEASLVLLILFPIVMLQYKYLMPVLLQHLSLTPAVFVSNVISVTLISWPMLPIAVYCLKWWLVSDSIKSTIAGVVLLLVLYTLEVIALQ